MTSVRSFTHAGATLVTESTGAGTPVYVLVHGIGMGRSVFRDLADHLDDDAHVVAIDLPGYGEAPEPWRVLTMPRNADLVAAFLRERIDVPAVLIGHSMGAQVVAEVAARHPSLVDRIVLVGPTVDPAARSALHQIRRLLSDIALESPRVIFAGAREYIRAGPRLRTKFRAMLVHRPEAIFPRIIAPTLVLRGEHDLVCPVGWCRQVAAAIPDARLEEVKGHGHETMIRDAAPAADLIRTFCDEH